MIQQEERTKSLEDNNQLELNELKLRSSENAKSQLKTKATVIASILGMIPALVIGVSTYYLASQSMKDQIERVRQEENEALIVNKVKLEKKLEEQEKQLLTIFSLGTGITTLLGAAIVGLWTNHAINAAMKVARDSTRLKGLDASPKRTELLTQAIRNIRDRIKEQDIFDVTVEELQRILECDRVVVYSLEDESRAKVIAEAVNKGWPRALGRTIEDPCFDVKYEKEYQNGRVRAIDNIYKGGMSPCYIKMLERLEIKANLVTPILNEGKILGLLVAHQCKAPRSWQQWEVDLTAQLASQVGFAIDNARILEKSALIQKQRETETELTQFFTEAIQYIRSSLEEKDVLRAVVKEVRRVLNCDRVVIYGLEEKNRGVVIAESVSPRWPRALGRTIEDPCFDVLYEEEYQNGRVRAIDNIYEGGMTPCYIEMLERLEVKANLVTPILNEGKILGLLVAHQCDAPRIWQQLEIRWLAQIAAQVGFSIDNARLLADSAIIQKQQATEVEWTNFFTDTVKYIRTSLKEEDILAATVEEVQRILNCDRVVIYGLEEKNRGVVIAESVSPRWPRALGRTIEDPCFDVLYEEEYQNGRVRAIDNIYEGGMTPCYIEMLERLEVKANLVTPILNEGKILGLLVAHQCDAPRIWQQLEIRWLAQIAAQVGFSIDNARLLADSAIIQKQQATEVEWTNFFTDTVKYIRTSLKEEDILAATVEEVQRILNCDRVVIYGLEEKNRGVVIAESVSPRWPRALGRTIEDPCFDVLYEEEYQNGRVRAIDNIYEGGMTPCYIEMLERLEVKANLVTPILNEGKILGLLVAHQCDAPRIWQQLEIRWLAQIAAQVGFSIDNARLLARSTQMQKQVEQMSQEAVIMSQEQLEARHLLQAKLPKLLAESKIDVSEFLTNIKIQEDKISLFTDRIQEIVDSASEVVAKIESFESQTQETRNNLGNETFPLEQTIDNMAEIETTIKQTTEEIDNTKAFFKQLYEIESLICDLREGINEQTMNLIIETGKGEQQIDRDSIATMADLIYSSTQQLNSALGEIKPVVTEMEEHASEINVKINNLQKQSSTVTELLDEIKSQLNAAIAEFDGRFNRIPQINETATNQLQNSTAAREYLLDLTALARQTSEQSKLLTNYLDDLESS